MKMRLYICYVTFLLFTCSFTYVGCGGGGGSGSSTPSQNSTSIMKNVLAWYEDPGLTNTVTVVGGSVPNATSYNLYSSLDGNNYTKVSTFNSPPWFNQTSYGFELDVPQNTYLRTTATVSGFEITPSSPVFMDYTTRNSLPLISILTPTNNQINLSLTPTFTWTAYSGAAEYVILMEEEPWGTGLGVLLKKCMSTTWAYGSQAGISFSYADTMNTLKPNTTYWFIVWAVDSSGTTKAIAKGVNFTTSP